MEDIDHLSSQSIAVIGSNEDLLTEILIHLPATSILRFKSVCKHWRSLLSQRHFTLRYDNNNLSKSPLGLFGHGTLKDADAYESLPKSLYIPFDVENPSTPFFGSRLDDYFNRSGVKIEQSCNGLLLCSAFHNNGASEYYVFNPTTKQLASIPSVPKTICSMALAFHPTHCVHYKVVCILYLYPNRDSIQVQVYSSDTRTWKICIESFSLPDSIFDHPVYWNGAVYWSPYKLLQFKLDAENVALTRGDDVL